MTEYIPTTEEIREYVEVGGEPRPWEEPDDEKDAKRAAAFDRWLAAHDAELTEKVRAAAIEEAAQVVLNYEPSFTTHRFVIAAIAALTGAAAAIRTLSPTTPERSNT